MQSRPAETRPARLKLKCARLVLPVVLDPGRAQTCEAVLVDGGLPVEELVDAEGVAGASFLEREQATANGSNDFSLAADNPAARGAGGKVRDGQWTSIRTDHVLDAW